MEQLLNHIRMSRGHLRERSANNNSDRHDRKLQEATGTITQQANMRIHEAARGWDHTEANMNLHEAEWVDRPSLELVCSVQQLID